MRLVECSFDAHSGAILEILNDTIANSTAVRLCTAPAGIDGQLVSDEGGRPLSCDRRRIGAR